MSVEFEQPEAGVSGDDDYQQNTAKETAENADSEEVSESIPTVPDASEPNQERSAELKVLMLIKCQ